MKKWLSIAAVLPFLAFQCEKESTKNNSEWLEGKVIRISCATVIVQLTNNTDIGQDGWKDVMDNNKEYNDVINASNKCTIAEKVTTGETIRFKVSAPKPENNCYVCLMYDSPPTVAYEIELKGDKN